MARSRSVTVAASGTGAQCPSLMESLGCNPQGCDVLTPTDSTVVTPATSNPPSLSGGNQDCVVGTWSPYSPCSNPCGGQSSRLRIASVAQSGNGLPCPNLSESIPCNVGACSSSTTPQSGGVVDCVVALWSEWSPCLCPSISQTRPRSISVLPANGGLGCPSLTDSRPCSCTSSVPSQYDSPATDLTDSDNNSLNDIAGGIPVWAWIVIGCAVVVIIIIIVVVIVVVKKSAASSGFSKFEHY